MEDVEAVDVSEVFVLVELKRQHLRGNLSGSRGRRSLEKYCNPSRILHIRKEQAMRVAQIQMAMAIFRDAGARRNSALLCRMQTAQTYLSIRKSQKIWMTAESVSLLTKQTQHRIFLLIPMCVFNSFYYF